MDTRAKFEGFLESLKGNGQDLLIESVKKGFKACMETAVADQYGPEYGYADAPAEDNSPLSWEEQKEQSILDHEAQKRKSAAQIHKNNAAVMKDVGKKTIEKNRDKLLAKA